MLSWLHIGDPHVADANEQNIRDLREIVAQANTHLAGSVDFALLPGDIANTGTPDQYRLVREAMRGLRLPLHSIPGDHDVVPADQRLITDPGAANQVSSGPLQVRCRAWGASEIVHATCRVDDGPASPMVRVARQAGMSVWQCGTRAADGACRLTVRVADAQGHADEDGIVARISRRGAWVPPGRVAAGSDADAVGAWPEKGMPGGRLGPNRNGRQW